MKSTAAVTTIAIDLAKDVFQLALADASWHVVRSLRLRMAIGAGPREIQLQFLAESMLISLAGRVIGIALGIGGTVLAEKFIALPIELNVQVILLATGFAVATGLFFGYYPARKASQLDPIEALRHQG